MKQLPPDVTKTLETSAQSKALALMSMDVAYVHANDAAVAAVTNFERAAPQYEGLIRICGEERQEGVKGRGEGQGCGEGQGQ